MVPSCFNSTTVYHVKCRETDTSYALKCHTNNKEDGDLSESAIIELSCLSALRGHPNIAKMLDCFLQEGEISTLMPYLPLMLFNVIYQGRCSSALLPISFIGHFSLEIANAPAYMHGLHMIHRDLTPNNVLLMLDTLTVKVADMELSRYGVGKGMSSMVVTKPNRAPELFCKKCIIDYTCAIDMWSLGVMIVDSMESTVSFFDPDIATDELIKQVLDPDEVDDHDCNRNHITVMPNVMWCKHVSHIVFKLLKLQPEDRLTASMLLNDNQWIRISHVTPDTIDHVKHYTGIKSTK